MRDSSLIFPILAIQNFYDDFKKMDKKNEEKLQEIRDNWILSKNFPRKLKKKVRKSLQLDYNIFSWAKDNLTNF